jgi:hypothetical protein
MLFACLLAAAELRNAAAYTGFAVGALLLTGYLLLVAVDTLKHCIQTLNDTVAVATGLNPLAAAAQAGHVASSAASLGLAAASGGAGLALAGAVATQQTGSGRYALGTMLGRATPLGAVGEIAAAMGDAGEWASGLAAGARSERGGVRALASIAAADGRRTDDVGRTFRDQATERQIARATATRPTVIDDLGAIAGTAGAAVRAIQRDALADALLTRGQQFGDVIQDRAGAASDAWHHFVDDVDTASGGSTNPLQRLAAGAQVVDRQLSRRGQAMAFDADRRRVVWSPRVPSSALPAAALQEPRDTVHVPRLLTLGYTVQENNDATVSFWPTHPPPGADSAALAARLARRQVGDDHRRLAARRLLD